MKKVFGNILLMISLVFLFIIQTSGQQTLAEKLGYAADDIGLAQSVNDATNKAFVSGGITSGSIMVPCPWFIDFAEYYKSNPDLDVGIHITLTSEWDYYKFGGVLPATEIPSLLDKNGYFYPTNEEVGQHADPVEAEKEIQLVTWKEVGALK